MELVNLFLVVIFLIAFITVFFARKKDKNKQQPPSMGANIHTKSSANSGSGDDCMTPILVASVIAQSSGSSSLSDTSDSSCDGGGDGGGGGGD